MRAMDLKFLYGPLMKMYVGRKRPERITILGMELAGEIESVGKDIKLFGKGDPVFASTGFIRTGACAEYICLPEKPEGGVMAIKPTNMTYEEAAPVPVGGLEALHFLRQGDIQSGNEILINGAGGTIGPYAVQLAKYYGAEVTAVDSTGKMDMLLSIGADQVIDYTKEDFTKSGKTYDVIIDMVSKSSYSRGMRSLKKNGRYVFSYPGLSQLVRGRWTSMTSSKKVLLKGVNPKHEDLIFLKEVIEAGKMTSVIDRRYPLEEVADAHRFVETGTKKGNVVITVVPNDKT